MPFQFSHLDLAGVVLIEPRVFSDDRGFFMESYKESDFRAAGLTEHFVQENHSRSKKGTLRGLHYQVEPKAQGKLVRVIAGEIIDVAVDIRGGSSTCGKWLSVALSSDNRRLLYLPPWCAHGFCVVSEHAEVVYKTTEEYAPECERGIMWNDPTLRITWPTDSPSVSARDSAWPPFRSK